MAGVHTYYSNMGFQRGLNGYPMNLHKIPLDCRFVYREAFLQAQGIANSTNPRPPKGGLFLRFIIWLGRKLGFFNI